MTFKLPFKWPLNVILGRRQKVLWGRQKMMEKNVRKGENVRMKTNVAKKTKMFGRLQKCFKVEECHEEDKNVVKKMMSIYNRFCCKQDKRLR